MKQLEKVLGAIKEPDSSWEQKAQERLDQLTKPRGSLGVLECIAVQLAGIQRTVFPEIKGKSVLVMAADHGIASEGVSAYPPEVTAQMVLNFLAGGAAINVLSRQAGAKVVVCDVGVASDMPELAAVNQYRVKSGTANMAAGPAMSREEAIAAVNLGISMAAREIDGGANLLATGDMGIGNTTPSTAILAAFTGCDPAEVTGRGTGLDDQGLNRKLELIRRSLQLNQPDPLDPLDVLSKVGGLEIAALSGVILGAAWKSVPVVVDGFISSAAALVASRLQPLSKKYMMASHQSQEPGHMVMMDALGLKPMLQLNMRLGEGTGAVLSFNLIEAAAAIIKDMATFSEAGVSDK